MTESSERAGIPAITGQIDYSRAFHIFPEPLKPFKSSILAYGASFLSTFAGYPFDTIKTRMQTYQNFTSYYDCAKKTYVKEGVVGFFRGILAPLISSSFSKSLNVSLFTQIKPICYTTLYGNTTDVSHPFVRNVPVCFASGFIVGGMVSVFACPFEFTKVYAQLEKIVRHKTAREIGTASGTASGTTANASSSTVQIARQIIKHQGPMGLYSGFRYHFVRDSLSSAIYYSIYESVKWFMNGLINSNPDQSSQISILLAGGVSGVASWTFIFPFDTSKSLVQKDIVTNILRASQGLPPLARPPRPRPSFKRSSYRGLGISVARSFLSSMIFFSAYESAMMYLA